MSRKHQPEPDAPPAPPEAPPQEPPPDDGTLASSPPAPALGEAPAARRARKARNPNAVRPHYYLIAVSRTDDRERIVGRAETVGRARKLVPALLYSLRDGEAGPFIVRAKLVS